MISSKNIHFFQKTDVFKYNNHVNPQNNQIKDLTKNFLLNKKNTKNLMENIRE